MPSEPPPLLPLAGSKIVSEDLAHILTSGLPFDVLHGKTVLVTGANGFLAAYLVETLLHANDSFRLGLRVIALARNQKKFASRFAHHLGRTDLAPLIQDVCAPIDLSGPVDFIIHAASQASPKFYGSDPVGTLLPNSLGTYRLLELAREKNVQGFLFISAGEVYGEVPAEWIPTAETHYGRLDPMAVRSCYAESKRLGETMCASWFHQFGVPTKVARPYHTYGPGMSLDDGRVFSDFVAAVVAGKDIILNSDGEATRSFCYLSDATEAFLLLLLKGAIGAAYNVGNPLAEISIRDLAYELTGLFPEKRLRVRMGGPSNLDGYLRSPVQRSRPDIAKLSALGWTPKHSIASGFRRTIEYYDELQSRRTSR